MRLSQAILKGCKHYPHHSRRVPYDNANGASTIGAAYAALTNGGIEWVRRCQSDYEYQEFPVILYWVRDPVSHGDELVESVIWRYENPDGGFVWSRERIAKWVAKCEKKWVKQGMGIDVGETVSKGRGVHPNRLWRER